MAKNSFTLFETLLALIITLILVSGFSKFTYLKSTPEITLQTIKNLLLTHQSNTFISYKNLGYTINNSTVQLTNGNTILLSTYQSDDILLEKFTLQNPHTPNIAFKEVSQ